MQRIQNSHTIMKRTLAILAALTTIGLTLPSEVKADWGCNHGARRVISYTTCGRPIFATYRIIGYDRCGNPVGQWVTDRSNCGCNTCSPRRPAFSGHDHHQPNFCPPNNGFGRSSGGFFFRFGR